MINSNVRYAKEFEQCEQENLRHTGAFQYGMHVFVFKENQMVGFSEGVNGQLKARAQAVLSLSGEKFAEGPHETIKDSSGCLWLKHDNNGYTF